MLDTEPTPASIKCCKMKSKEKKVVRSCVGGSVSQEVGWGWASDRCTSVKYLGGQQTFVFEEVAHSRAACENQLRHVLDNLGFILWRKCGEPFGEALCEDESYACDLRIVLYIPLCPALTEESSSFNCQRKTSHEEGDTYWIAMTSRSLSTKTWARLCVRGVLLQGLPSRSDAMPHAKGSRTKSPLTQ